MRFRHIASPANFADRARDKDIQQRRGCFDVDPDGCRRMVISAGRDL